MSISSVVNLAAENIGALLIEEAKLLYGVKDQVESLKEELMMMQSYLIDMEEGGEDERTNTTIQQVRKVAYEVEDVIESYIVEANLSKGDFFKSCLCFCKSLLHKHQVGSDIVAIKARIVEIKERWIRYSGGTLIGKRSSDGRQGRNKRNKQIAHSYNIEDHVVGLDEDIKKLVQMLTTDEECITTIQVVSFVGMGGSGKTTLARKLYNHESIIKHFDCLAWVSISQQWVVKQILLDLLHKVGGGGTNEDSTHILSEKLYECLKRKRSLIVLDDVWEKEVLEQIFPAFPLSSDRGKIIVTTRKQHIVNFPNIRCFTHEPRRLTEEESWELFRRIFLIHGGSTLDIFHALEPLGKEMLKKCKGLPLAVIALAGILCRKESVEEWKKISMAVSSRIMEGGGGTHLYGSVNEMLALSYYDLPCHLKPCFLYLAMFPEDCEIRVGQLIKIWIAEGFITSDQLLNEGDTIEDLAHEYVDELVQRCLVQVVYRDYQQKVKKIRIHDLVRDLCIRKAKEEDFLEVYYFKSLNPDRIVSDSRRAAIYSHDSMEFQLPTQNRHLRSLVCEGGVSKLWSIKVTNLSCILLRVLLLEGVETSDATLPTEIGRLIHLRFLGLRGSNIAQLPSSIGKLRNLFTLDYRVCRFRAKGLPNVIWEIDGLRHLYLHFVLGKIFQVERLQLHTLKKLQTLWCGTLGGNWIFKDLPHLSPSVQKLFVGGITSKKQLNATFQCPSIHSDHLQSLELCWFDYKMPHPEMEVEDLGAIVHCQHLRKLKLKGKIGDGLHGIQFPSCITMLRLAHTRFSTKATLVALGKLPYLSKLDFYYNTYTGTKWACSTGEFPKLQQLRVYGFPHLEEWSIERGAMPQLRVLKISGSQELKRIPNGLEFVTTLQELRVESMNAELKKRLRGEDAHIIQHVPLVQIW